MSDQYDAVMLCQICKNVAKVRFCHHQSQRSVFSCAEAKCRARAEARASINGALEVRVQESPLGYSTRGIMIRPPKVANHA
jgi:hypothetical protein